MGKRLTIVLAVFALMVVPLSIYTAGYFLLGEVNERRMVPLAPDISADASPTTIERTYRQQWMRDVYKPVGKLEEWTRGVEVEVTWGEMPRQ